MAAKQTDTNGTVDSAGQSEPMAEAPVPVQIISGPRLPKRTKWVRMPDVYGDAGFKLNIWTNAPSRLADAAFMANAPQVPTYKDLESKATAYAERERNGEDVTAEMLAIDDETAERQRIYREDRKAAEDRRIDALGRIVVEHNGWLDDEGKPYPPASDPTFWEVIPDELAAAILVIIRQENSRLPSQMIRSGRR